MVCLSSALPSVVETSACVSPRVNTAMPWARGTTRSSQAIGRISVVLRPSMRTPSARMRSRTTSERRSCSGVLGLRHEPAQLAAPRLDGLEAVEARGSALNSPAIVSTTADSVAAIAA